MADRTLELEVNGLRVAARISGAAEDALRPLVDRLFQEKARRRGPLVAFLAGPPGSGKSTLSLILERLAAERAPGLVQALPMDGYHHTAAYIAGHTVLRGGELLPMARLKGSPESFDAEGLEAAIRGLGGVGARWNGYDRRTHDVAPGAIPVTGEILLVEGNWLLLDESGFSDLAGLCDISISLSAEEELLRDRLIDRKRRGGASLEAAIAHYEACDRPNILRYRAHSAPGDVRFRVLADGRYEPEM